MLAAGIKTPEVLGELENHLREDIEQQLSVGLNAQQAFANASVRLGQASALKAEFARGNTMSKIFDRLRLALCLLFVAGILWLSGFTFSMLGMSPGEWILASSAVAASLGVAVFWRHAARFLPVIQNKRKRYAIESVLFVSGFICSNLFGGFVLPYFERNLNGKILPPIWLWLVFPMAFFMAFAAGVEKAWESRKESIHL